MYSQIVKETFNSIFEKKYVLIKALVIPFLILLFIKNFYPTPEDTKEYLGSSNFYILIFCSLCVNIILAITVHRILLLDMKEYSFFEVLKIGKRELNFAFHGILVVFISILFSVISSLIIFALISIFIDSSSNNSGGVDIYTLIVVLIIFLVGGYTFSRLSFVFPSISIDRPIDLSSSLDLSKHHKLLVFTMVFIMPLFLGLIIESIYGIIIGFLIGVFSEELDILYSLLNIFITVFSIAFLSTTYEYIIKNQPLKKETVEELKKIEYKQTENSYIINIDDKYDISFDEIKESLFKQYELLGFTDIRLDKEHSWLLKNPEIEKAYILLTHEKNQYKIETFNIEEKPIIDLD